MRIAYVDDEKIIADEILELLQKAFSDLNLSVSNLSYYYNSEDFFKDWHPSKYDIIFLDIFLKDSHGVEIARQIRETDDEVRIVFCSTSNEFAMESYEVSASFYLTKPVSYEKMRSTIARIVESIVVKQEYITLKDGQKLLINSVIFSDYHNHRITIKMKNSSEIQTWSSQKDFLSAIQNYNHFLAITPGTVINMNEVASLDKDTVIMSDGTVLPISRRNRKEVNDQYQSFLFEKLRSQ